MFASSLRISARGFATSAAAAHKVTVIGAAGGIGQPLTMLLKQSDYVKEIAAYDVAPVTRGVAADLSHINTPAQIKGYLGAEELGAALKGSHVVVIPAGVPRKPGMTRDDLFSVNAKLMLDMAKAIAQHAPKALVAVICNPVNSTVPIIAETLKKSGVYDPKRLFGVTTLDILRANTFVAEAKGLDVHKVSVPVIGGHAGVTILPLISQTSIKVSFTDAELEKMTTRIQNAGTEVVEAKAGHGSATLSMAVAGFNFTRSLLRGLSGESNVVECTFVESNVHKTKFFANPVLLGRNGVEKNLGYGTLSAYETKALEKLTPELEDSIKKGIDFVAKNY